MLRGVLIIFLFLIMVRPVSAEQAGEDLSPVLKLDKLIEVALKENHDILMAGSGIEILKYRIPQAGAPPDPMVMVGYENEGWSGYTYGEMPGARWVFSVSQMIPWPGKLKTKELSLKKERESLISNYEKTRLIIIEELKSKYHELLFAYKSLDATEEKIRLLERMEEIALSRYSAGMATLSEVTMAQAEKYMALEQRVMYRQKIKALEAMINSIAGRDPLSPLGRPEEVSTEKRELDDKDLIERAMDSPEIEEIKRLIESRQYKVKEAGLEYYPDLTLSAQVSLKPEPYEDMWMLSLSFNIPLFYSCL